MTSEGEVLVEYFRWVRSRGGYEQQGSAINRSLLSDPDHRDACQKLKHHPEVVKHTSAGQDLDSAIISFLSEAIEGMGVRDKVALLIVLGPAVLGWAKDTPLPNGTLPPYRRGTIARRKYVRENYTGLIEGLGGWLEDGETAPRDGSLRELNGIEDRAISSLVERIIGLKVKSADRRTTDSIGRAIVFGMAVVDHVYQLPDQFTPVPPGSVQVDYLEAPGGKGLAQAIAMSRMGFDTTLVAAVGEDHNADKIVDALKSEGMSSESLVARPGQSTPITGVLSYPFRGSLALGWKNENRVRLEPDDIEVAFLRHNVDEADFVLLTYELPTDIINHVLHKLTHRRVNGVRKPIVVLTPSPPMPQNYVPAEIFRVDYVVTDDWEAQRFLGEGRTEKDSVKLASIVLGGGVGAVCMHQEGRLTITRKLGDPLVHSAWPFPVRHDSTGERDALVGALAYELMHTNGKLDVHAMAFMAAAMAKAATVVGRSDCMPYPEDVIELMRNTETEVANDYMKARHTAK